VYYLTFVYVALFDFKMEKEAATIFKGFSDAAGSEGTKLGADSPFTPKQKPEDKETPGEGSASPKEPVKDATPTRGSAVKASVPRS